MSMGNGSNGQQHPPQNFYPDFAGGLARMIRDTQARNHKAMVYFQLEHQLLIELGNFALDVAESISRQHSFDPAILRERVAVINGLIDQAPVSEAIPVQHRPAAGYAPQQQGYQMREVLDRAGPPMEDGNGYDHGPYPYPQQFTR